jgi:hypothetical protein
MRTNSQHRPDTRPEADLDRRTDGVANLAQGWLIAPEFGSQAGVEYESRTTLSGNEAVLTKKLKYDSHELHLLTQKAINHAYYVLRQHCAPVFNGLFFCPFKEFDVLDKELQESRDVAHTANLMSKKIRSKRKTRIEVFPMYIDPTSPRHAIRIGQSIYWRLMDLRNTFRADEKNAFTMEMRNAHNLHKLVTGHQHDVIKAAVDSAVDQRPVMIQAYGGRKGKKELLERYGKIPELDYGPIDQALKLFEPVAEAFL